MSWSREEVLPWFIFVFQPLGLCVLDIALFLPVCVHVLTCLYYPHVCSCSACMYTHMWKLEEISCYPQEYHSSLLEQILPLARNRYSHWPGAYQLGQIGWPAITQNPSVSIPPALGLQQCDTNPSFYMNSGIESLSFCFHDKCSIGWANSRAPWHLTPRWLPFANFQ